MDNKEILKETRELLAGGKMSVSFTKKFVYDKQTKQLAIKIPRDVAKASGLNQDDEFTIVSRPTEDDLRNLKLPSFIIYGKAKDSTK